MAKSEKFTIPPEFTADLHPIAIKDSRENEEILKSLAWHVPVTSEKNVWAFWDKGIDKMPDWCKRNVCDWVRILGSGDKPWTVRVLDALPDSANYALKFVPKEMLPQAFVDGEMVGPYVGPHSADFLRGALLYQYGGANMDVGCILIRHLDRVGWDELEDPTSPFNIAVPHMYQNFIANHFVMARKSDPFIKRWHELFVHLWKGRKDHQGLCDNPLVGFGANLNFDDTRASDFHWEFAVSPRTAFEYIGQVLAWKRLTMLEEAGDGFSCSDYWQKHILVFDVLKENWAAEATVGFDGQVLCDTLATRLDADPQSAEYKKAYGLVWRLLTKSSMQKVTHGKNLTKGPSMGVLWEMSEHDGKDCAPGTFAELLRYGSVHFEQTRKEIVRMKAEKSSETMKKGVLEP